MSLLWIDDVLEYDHVGCDCYYCWCGCQLYIWNINANVVNDLKTVDTKISSKAVSSLQIILLNNFSHHFVS